MSERLLALRFDARCRSCGRDLPAGSKARWNPQTKWVACVRCPSAMGPGVDAVRSPLVPPSPSLPDHRPGPTAPAPNSIARDSGNALHWQSLVHYHLGGVQRAATTDPPLVNRHDEWATLRHGREELITGRRDEIPLTPELRGIFSGTSANDCVYYGWPLLFVADRTGRPRVAPLFLTELVAPGSGTGDVALAGDDQPYLNPGLLTEEFFPADAVASVWDDVAGGLPFGDAGAFRACAVHLLRRLGLEDAAIDPDCLVSQPERTLGAHNCAVAFRGISTIATRGLIEELIELQRRGDWRSTAARFLLEPPLGAEAYPEKTPGAPPFTGPGLPSHAPGPPPISVEGLTLNDSQERALVDATREDLTVVTGPPGTGKSQLVAGIVVNQWMRGRSVLVASTNNGAVDVAARRCTEIDPAILLRTGNRALRDALPPLLDALAARGTTAGPSPTLIGRKLQVSAAERDAVHDRLEDRSAKEASLAALVLEAEGLRDLIWGDAEQRPGYELRAEIHRLAVRAARSRWRREGRRRRLLALTRPSRDGIGADDVAAWAAVEHRVDALTAELMSLGPADPERDRRDLRVASEAWARAGTTALRDMVQQGLGNGGAALRHLAQMRVAARAARCAATARTLPYVPGWACTTLSVRSNFPLTAGLFDLLVIDEASQCSIADVLPLAYRARRIVVVGDPNQLTPVVTLAPAELDAVARAAGTSTRQMRDLALSVGDDSAYTAFSSRSRTSHLLDEHYRCHPAIARFVNEEFYAGALRILTDVAGQSGSVRGVSLVRVRGRSERGTNGGALNEREADEVVRWVLDHVDEPGTLGVVTPFAAQAALIRRRLERSLTPEAWEAKRLAVGTAHRFQGDARDVMLFSTVLSESARAGTARWVEEQRNLVNVAVSRARRALVVFADPEHLADLPVPTLHRLVEFASGARPTVPPEDGLTEVGALHSDAERRLFAALARRGIVPEAKVVVDGYELDFALRAARGPIDIEVDGVYHLDPRGRRRRQDLVRDRILEHMGWRVVRIPAWRCLTSPDQEAATVESALAEMGGPAGTGPSRAASQATAQDGGAERSSSVG